MLSGGHGGAFGINPEEPPIEPSYMKCRGSMGWVGVRCVCFVGRESYFLVQSFSWTTLYPALFKTSSILLMDRLPS